MQGITKFKGELSVIAQSSEKYISFEWKTKLRGNLSNSFIFLDSFAFLLNSLDGLAKNLKTFPIFNTTYKKKILRKKVYILMNGLIQLKSLKKQNYHQFHHSILH